MMEWPSAVSLPTCPFRPYRPFLAGTPKLKDLDGSVSKYVSIQPNAVTDIKRHGILDPEGVVHTAQAEGLGLCPCL